MGGSHEICANRILVIFIFANREAKYSHRDFIHLLKDILHWRIGLNLYGFFRAVLDSSWFDFGDSIKCRTTCLACFEINCDDDELTEGFRDLRRFLWELRFRMGNVNVERRNILLVVMEFMHDFLCEQMNFSKGCPFGNRN